MNILYLTPQLWQTIEISELSTALTAFNLDFQNASLTKDKTNPHLKNDYVSLDNLLNVVRPLLTKNGLSITQDLAGEYLITTLIHKSGQFKGSAMPFSPMGGNNAVSDLQKIGGGITYAKRYAVSALLSISVDTDEDGNDLKQSKTVQVTAKKKVSDADIHKLIEYAKENKLTLVEILKSRDLTASQIETIKNELN